MNLLSLGGFFSNIWMDLWISLNAVVYQFIEWLYEIFEVIANVNLFSREAFDDITGRLYIVIGIAMLFIFAYNIILMIINPEDKKSMGNTGKVVKETIIALVLIILLPTIFNYMSIFQKNLLDSHVLEQIILGNTAGTTVDCDFSDISVINNYVKVKDSDATMDLQNKCNTYHDPENLNASQKGAYLVAPTIFTAFFHPKNYGYNECVNYLTECTANSNSCGSSSDGLITTDDDKELCAYYVYDTNVGQFTGGIANFTTDDRVYSDAWSDKGIFDFNYLMAFVAGIIAVWMFICYAMAIGVRVAKLGFLQIISPIPVMLRIIPKQKEAVYDKWFKQLLNTYLDVFIRLAIIYFCMFGISLVPDVMDSLFASLTGNIFTKALATVVVILGILQFAQEAPKLLQEFFGGAGGGNFALKSPKKQLTDNKYAMGGLGMIGGGVSSAVRNAVNAKGAGKVTSAIGGLFGGARRGFNYGSEAKDFDALKRGIITSQSETDAARRKHEAIRRGEGQIFGKDIPIVSGVWGQAVHSWKDVKKGATDFKDFLFGNVPSSELGNAANIIMVDVDNMEADFSNANIANIKDGRSEVMKKFNADQDFDFNGKHYSKVDANHWSDGTRRDIKHEDLGKSIVESYKDRLALAYAQNELKDGIYEGFKRANEGMLKDLRDSLPKFGEDFSRTLFDKLNNLKDVNGTDMNLNVKSIDELESRMKQMIDSKSEKDMASIYKINDEIKSLAKGVKISNDQALKAQAANKDKKDK